MFDLITAEYDVRNSPSGPDCEVRRLAADPGRFQDLRHELPQHIFQLPPEAPLIRVRGHEGVPNKPWPSHEMRGHPKFPWARANLNGQPVIYCADCIETAFDEVRAQSGAWFTVAVLKPRSPLKLVRLTGIPGEAGKSLDVIDGWLSRPVLDRARVFRADPSFDPREHYYGTQLFSCLAREAGYDGIQFCSSVHEGGKNVVFFDPYCLDFVQISLEQA